MKSWIFALGVLAMTSLSSCINEWPHPEDRTYKVTLLVHSDTDWIPDYVMNYTRTDGRADALEIQYQFRIFRSGDTSIPLREFTMYSSDMSRGDFSVDIDLNPGSYDVYVWSDICNAASGESLFYNSSDFANITFLTPYQGDSNYKDAFRGMKSFTIENSMYLHPVATEVINLERPLVRYIFVATDLDEFVDKEITRGKMRNIASRERDPEQYRSDLDNVLGEYTIKISYPLYMPAVFDNYSDKPIDSWTGISFEGDFTILSEEQAQLGLDYVMMGSSESYIQVMMEIFDSDGFKIAGTSTINVPTLRDRTTLIYGRFLTSDEDAGVHINPDFDGQYNIPYN